MSLLVKQTIVPGGLNATHQAAAASDTMPVGDRLFLSVKSTHTATISVAITGQGTLNSGDAYPNKTIVVPIGSVTPQQVLIPLLKDYQNATTGVATVTCTPITAVTLAVVER